MPRSKPHFKVRTTVMNHAKMAAVWNSNDLLAAWVRLGVLGIERFADRTGDVFIVSDRELPLVTGKGRADIARTSLVGLSVLSPISAERDGDIWRITFHNFAKVQGFKWRNGVDIVPSAPPPAPTPSPKTIGKPESPRKKRKPKPPPSAAAFGVTDHLIEKLKARHPGAKIHRTAWARAIDGLETRGECVAEIIATIDWLFSAKNLTRDYPYVVHSGTALVEKWSKVREAMGKGNRVRTPQRPPEPSTQETPTPATPEEVEEARTKEIARLEGRIRKGEATGYDVNRLHQLKSNGRPRP